MNHVKVRMIDRHGNVGTRMTGVDATVARQWEADGICQIVKPKEPAKAAMPKPNKTSIESKPAKSGE